jgi:hypothetical protein
MVTSRETALYFYGPPAAVLDERLATVLASHPLAQCCRAVRRFTVITQVVNDFSPPQERNTHVTQSYGAAHQPARGPGGRPGRITDVNAGHLSLISKPSVVTRVILKAVRATG